jgi:hypothetical protein
VAGQNDAIHELRQELPSVGADVDTHFRKKIAKDAKSDHYGYGKA